MKTNDSSKIFCGHRALGYVSNHVPLICRYVKKRRENLIATSVGKSFHTYGGAKLGLLSVSGIHPEEITTLAADTFMVYSAAGNQIYAWRRGCELKHIYKGHESQVKLLLPFGPHLISIDANSQLKVFDIKSEKSILHLEFDPKSFNISAICHPITYKDKILLGSTQGILQLWNLKSAKRIYQFRGWESSITCLVPCPTVLDAVAIGLKSGEIVVHNLKFDETFVKFKQDWGPVTSLAFRSDRNDLLISGSSSVPDDQDNFSGSGHIAIWNLNEKKLSAQMRDAHISDVTGMACFPGEPILVTSSPDNTIKQWIFDMPDGGGRLLKLREGHAEPPTKIRFYGSLGNNILSASEDSSLRSFSTVTDLLNKSFGVASYNRKLSKKHKKIDNPVKMNPIVDFTTETSKEKEWDNIACVHRDTTVVTTWSFKKQKMGDLKLRHPRFKENPKWRDALATCLNLSMCGNFVFIGYDSGHVDKFNIQSGIHRGSLGQDDQPAHPEASIRGIVTDGLNQIVITGDNSGLLKFWRFSTHALLKGDMSFDSSVRHMILHRESSLMAVGLDDLNVEIIDVMTRKTVRRFSDVHQSPITDMIFSKDSRWLLTSSLDKTVKVWDVPSGSLIDHLGFSQAVTSLTFSPTAEFLATTHLNDLGIYLWSNKSLYGFKALKPLDQDESQPIQIRMPTVSKSQEDILSDALEELEMDHDDDNEEDMEEVWSKEQIDNCITLAGLPPARWQNLHNIDVIKARNKPKEAVQKPKNAPFFLPTVTGPDGQIRFNLEAEQENENENVKKPIILEQSLTSFGQKLWDTKGEDTSVLELLKEMGPSAIDLEIVALSPEGGGSIELMAAFLNLLNHCFDVRKDFEACHAYLGLFLKHHSDTVLENAELLDAITELRPKMTDSWKDLKQALTHTSTLVSFCKNSLLTAG